MIQKIEKMIEQIQQKVYILPLIAGLTLLFLFGQLLSAIGCFLIAWSRSLNPHGNEMGYISKIILWPLGGILIILGLFF